MSPETTGNLKPAGRGRVLCIPDRPDWIFNRHAQMLSRYLSDEFDFTVVYRGDDYHEDDYDLIYPLEWNMVDLEQIRKPEKYVTAIRSFVSWVDWDFQHLVDLLVHRYQAVHVISRQLYDLFSPFIPGLQHITQGVDLEAFTPQASPGEPITPVRQAGRLRLGWAGNRISMVKGFQEFVQPMAEIPGVELVVAGFADHNLPLEQMPDFYRSIDAYISASSFEGSNNSIIEAAAMQRAIVTTRNGSAPEYLTNEQNALIVNRDLDEFRAAVIRLRDQPELCSRLGAAARQALIDGGWSWVQKAEHHRQFFRQALRGEGGAPTGRPPVLIHSESDYLRVLQAQYELERELRSGYAWMEFNRRLEIDELRRQIAELRDSETYRMGERIKTLPGGRSLTRLYQRLRKNPQ